MAFTISRSRIAPVLAKLEATYGTDPTPVAATDDLLTINSSNTFQGEFSTFELRPHGSSFTRQKDIIGARVARRDVRFLLQGGSGAGVLGNGATSIGAMLMACGLKETVVASTSVTYAPATLAQLVTFGTVSPKSGSVTIWGDHNGMNHKTSGCWGNMIMSGNPTGGVLCEFSGLGIYSAPVASSTSFDAFAPTNRALPVLNVGLSVTPLGGSAYTTGVMKSFRFDMGVDVQRVMDCNDATGLKSLLFADRNPTLDLVIAMDTDGSANLSYANIYANLIASTTHLATWKVPNSGGTAGNIIQFNFPTLQLLNATLGDEAGHRTVTMRYKVQHTTPETEFNIAIT